MHHNDQYIVLTYVYNEISSNYDVITTKIVIIATHFHVIDNEINTNYDIFAKLFHISTNIFYLFKKHSNNH